MRRILTSILDFQLRHPVVVLIAALCLAALSVRYTYRDLGFLTSPKDLNYADNHLLKLSREIRDFEGYDTFVVVIENRDEDRSLAFLHALVPHLEADRKHFSQLFYRVNPESFKPWALLYLKPTDLAELEKNLREHAALIREMAASQDLVGVLGAINHEMASAMVGDLFTGFLEDKADTAKKPVDLGFVIRVLTQMHQALNGDPGYVSPMDSLIAAGSSSPSWSDTSKAGYFWTRDKHFLLLFVTPKATDAGFSNKLDALKRLRTAISDTRGAGFPDIQVGVTGQEALNQDEMGTALQDIRLATGLSLGALALLLIVFWRGIRRPILEMVELIVALCWTFGLTTLFIGHLNILSVTFAPMLLGLGIDYGIHWLARYVEEVQQLGQSREAAMRATMIRLGPSIVLAGLSASASFFPLMLTGFRGLVELGKITSMGMIMTTVTTLCLLPSLLMLFDKAAPARPKHPAPERSDILFRLGTLGARIILGLSALAFVGSLWGMNRVSFDLNMLHLQSKGAESVIWEHKLLAESDRSSTYGAILARTMEELTQKTRLLQSLSTVSEVQSVLSMMPEDQEEKIASLKELEPLIGLPEPAGAAQNPIDMSRLNDVLGRIHFKMLDSRAADWGAAKPLVEQMRQVRTLIEGLRNQFQSMDPGQLERRLEGFSERFLSDLQDKFAMLRMNLQVKPMRPEDLPLALRQRYISGDGRYLMRIFPSGDIWEPAFLARFVQDLQTVDPNAIGDPVTLEAFTKAYRNACIQAAIYAIIFIALLLLVTFKNFFHAFLVMTPLIAGTVWTIGLMVLFGVDFNLANSLFLPLIVGAGVEYGIIIVQRQQQDGFFGDKTALPASTTKGVILAGLTTTVGFCSLGIAHHQGIASLGILATIGSLSILLAAVIFLPALIQSLRLMLKGNFLEKRP
jgi:hopanoid biosynthesis associated RND transporter like protein HpnN